MKGQSRGLAAAALAAALAVQGLAGNDWPQWRGPRRDGTTSVRLPEALPAAMKPLWEAELGEGDASPVVAGDRVVVFVRRGEGEALVCLSATDGRRLWEYAYSAAYAPLPPAKGHGQGPFSTPAISGDRVYALGVSGTLTSISLTTGRKMWQKTFEGQFKVTHPEWGAAASPLVDDGRCLVPVGGKDDGLLMALYAQSGEVVWKGPPDGPAYGSPIAAVLAGRRQILVMMQHQFLGADAADGRKLWSVPFETKYAVNCNTPLVYGDVVVESGFRHGTTAWRIAAGKEPEQVWRREDVSFYMSSPVPAGDSLYGLCEGFGGAIVCLSARDGSQAWASPGSLGEFASLILSDGKLLVLTTQGTLILAKAAPDAYHELGRVRLTERTVWAHPALTDGRLFVKDKTHVACFELKPQ